VHLNQNGLKKQGVTKVMCGKQEATVLPFLNLVFMNIFGFYNRPKVNEMDTFIHFNYD